MTGILSDLPGWAWAVIAGLSFGVSQLSNRGLNREMHALRATAAMVTALFGFLVLAAAVTGQLRTLRELSMEAFLWFAAASLLHFLAGWSLFAVSQQWIGPSRTASILAVNPVMAAIAAWVILSETLRPITWAGVVAVTMGVGIITRGRLSDGASVNPAPALVATVCFSISPIFVRWGLDDFDHPLVALLVGMAVTVPAMHVSSRVLTGEWVHLPAGLRRWLLLGGFTAALALAAQWTAFALVPVGVAIALQQLNSPVVIFLGPLLLAAPAERATLRLLGGTALVIFGSVLVALFGGTL